MSHVVFNDSWYAGCQDAVLRAAQLYIDYLWRYIQPRSVLDVGCGRGEWLRVWLERGVERALGLDGIWNCREALVDPRAAFEPHDLNEPFHVGSNFDLTMTLEVAEHLEPRSAGAFIGSLCRTSDLILFSAAYCHQGGPQHVNERPHTYWAGLLAGHGFVPFDLFRPVFWGDERVPFWYRQNTFLYAREQSASLAALTSHGLAPLANVGFMDCIHPALFTCKIEDIKALRSR